MVDSGCFKTKLKKEKRRTDEEKTENRRGKDEGIDGDQTRIRRRSDEDQTKGEGKEKARRRQGEINKAALSAALFIGYLN